MVNNFIFCSSYDNDMMLELLKDILGLKRIEDDEDGFYLQCSECYHGFNVDILDIYEISPILNHFIFQHQFVLSYTLCHSSISVTIISKTKEQ